MADVNCDLEPMNSANFLKMAHGDLHGLRLLAFDFFNDTRRQMTGWLALQEAGNFHQLREDLHRIKGGASLFGLERIVAMIGAVESPAALETRGFDLADFERELSAAERAVVAMTV
ncbi:MAG: Hpt domain-containing protein [Verrucomicrobiota bacterium]